MLWQFENIAYTIGLVFGTILGMIIRVIIYSFFLAIIVRTSTRLFAKFTPKFGRAYKTSFAALFLSYLALIVVRMSIISGMIDPTQFPAPLQSPLAKSMFNLSIVIFISSGIYGVLLSDNGERIGLLKGLLVSVLNMVIIVAMVIAISSLSRYPVEVVMRLMFLI